uniref:Enoyl reductase (ER) domain-containing protein n=1 Tax=Schizophyllum commune (strain H4-8 / FGSC 9210) TaxID=578458 RepID=D8Q1R7_SCHCM
MAPIPNPRVVFAKPIPEGAWPVIGEHLVYDDSRTIDLDNVPLNGGYLTKALYLSPEPYMRVRMRDENIIDYSSPMKAGAPVVSLCVLKVLRSEKEGFEPGDLLYGGSQWELYTVQPYVPDPKGAFPLYKYCSLGGAPGMTAYASWKKYADAKKGETVFVSAGASAVGSMIIQFAKLDGLKVIASAGSDAKVEYMRSLGCDVPFNYKTTPYKDVLAKNGPIDIYYDNVGAEAFAAALDNMALFGRVIICGQIAEYNVAAENKFGIKNTDMIYKLNLTVNGFLTPYLAEEYAPKFFVDVPPMIAEGKLKSEERIYDGIESAPQAFVDMLKGGWDTANGKVVVSLVDQ